MNDLQEHQKSAARVAHMALNYLRIHRLFPCDPRTMGLAELEVLGRALLDHAESLAAARKEAAPAAASVGSGTPSGAPGENRTGRQENDAGRFCR